MSSLRRLVVLNLTTALVFFGVYAWPKVRKTENKCLSCHMEVYNQGSSNTYQHSPFHKGECDTCHLKQEEAKKAKYSFMTPVILTNRDYLIEHSILLKRLTSRASYNINVKLKDMSGNEVKTEFRGLIPARVRNLAKNDKKPPLISGITVGPTEKATFLSTTILWDTDEPSTSCVKHGPSDQYGKRSPEDINMVTHHRVCICELESDKDYHFRVISRDMYGNQAVSKNCVFNTAKISQPDVVEVREPVKLAVKKTDIFLRRKRGKSSDLGLYIKTTRPANMTVEYVKIKHECADLSVGQELAIDACYRCHPSDVLGLTHPVGVAAKPTTKIPDDLPTLKGGIITCVTCHNVHGGNIQHFTRRKTTSCATCHME